MEEFDVFLKKKEESLEKKLNHKLTRCNERLVILEAIVFACENYTDIMEIILASEDSKEAKENLSETYGFLEHQSQAIIDMRMKAFTKVECKKLYDECQECRRTYVELQKEIALLIDKE